MYRTDYCIYDVTWVHLFGTLLKRPVFKDIQVAACTIHTESWWWEQSRLEVMFIYVLSLFSCGRVSYNIISSFKDPGGYCEIADES